MPQYKLIYFDAKGRAELTRWIFAYGGIDYVDERIKKEDWPERKKTVFTGKVPVLMVDDTPLPQSLAIARYAAKLTGLVPEDTLEASLCDAISDALADITREAYKIWLSDRPEEEKIKVFEETFYPNIMKPSLGRFETRLKGREWIVNDKMTWADLHFALVVGRLMTKKPEKLEPFPPWWLS